MLGFVLPKVFLSGSGYRDARERINGFYDSVQLVELPDIVFRYAQSETVLVIAHGGRTGAPQRRCARVLRDDYTEFSRTGEPTWAADVPSEQITHQAADTLWYSPLERVWAALAPLPRLRDVAAIHRGVEYIGYIGAYTADSPRAGFVRGVRAVRGALEPYWVRATGYLSMEPASMRPRARGAFQLAWRDPKVVANAARLSRGTWTIAAAVDESGLVCSQRFHGIWQAGAIPLEVIAAVLNGPVANAWIVCQRTSRDNQIRFVDDVRVPEFSESQIATVTSLVRMYRSYRDETETDPLPSPELQLRCWEALWRIDAAVLAAYQLPAELEAEVLKFVATHGRPGPNRDSASYPDHFPDRWLPDAALHERLQRRRLRRYGELVDKKYLGGLSVTETDELERLRREAESFEAAFYEPLIARLRERIDQVRRES
jgi:hypothetical protein